MMKAYSALVAIGIVCFAVNGRAMGNIDPRLAPISQVDLQKSINLLPLNSSEHLRLISEARSSHLAAFAYDQYKIIYQNHPNNADASLLAGTAALSSWEYQTSPSVGVLQPYSSTAHALLAEAGTLLSRAIKSEPNSAEANMEYGSFLWRYGYGYNNSADLGFTFIQKSVRLSPHNPTAHALLGDVCANRYGPYAKHYNAAHAAMEYQAATALDPLYAYPHLQLVFLNLSLERYAEAQIQMKRFLSLTPTETANDKIILLLRTAIGKGLRNG